MRLSCIGIGSNAIRLLCADWNGEELCNVLRERRGTRLFAGLINGRLTDASIQSSVDAVQELAGIARENGAQKMFVFATSAVRDAVNGDVFTSLCEQVAGVPVEIISGEEEAILAYWGAVKDTPGAVIDIGGGSTEFSFGREGEIEGAVSLQLGAVRMNGAHPICSGDDYEAACELSKALIQAGIDRMDVSPAGRVWSGVGGTMTTLGAMMREIELFDPICEGMEASYEDVHGWGKRLAEMSMEERRHVMGLMPHRADIIPCGLAILDAAMQVLGMKELHLSAQGNMDGYLKKKFAEMG